MIIALIRQINLLLEQTPKERQSLGALLCFYPKIMDVKCAGGFAKISAPHDYHPANKTPFCLPCAV